MQGDQGKRINKNSRKNFHCESNIIGPCRVEEMFDSDNGSSHEGASAERRPEGAYVFLSCHLNAAKQSPIERDLK